MKTCIHNITFFFLLSLLCFAADNDRPDSHRKIIFRLTDSIIQKITVDNGQLSAASVVVTMSEQPQDNYLKQQIIQSLVSRNVGVLLHQNAADTTIACNVREVSLCYGEVFSESFFGERKVGRMVSLSLDVTMSSVSSGKVFYSQNITKVNSDTVLYSLVSQLHDDSLPLTMAVQPRLSFFDSIIEPAIVTIASGIAVYLFFTIRS